MEKNTMNIGTTDLLTGIDDNTIQRKKIKRLKEIDLSFQILVPIVAVAVGVLYDGFWIFGAYFALGTIQVVSMFVHFGAKGDWVWEKARKSYSIILLIIVGCLLASTPFGGVFFILFFLLLAAPFIALFYGNICFTELKNLKNATS